MVGFINTKFAEKLQNNIILNNIVIFIIHIHLLSFSSNNPSQCLTKPANKIKKINCINKTVKIKLKIELWAQSLHAVNKLGQSTVRNYTLPPCTNIKNY